MDGISPSIVFAAQNHCARANDGYACEFPAINQDMKVIMILQFIKVFVLTSFMFSLTIFLDKGTRSIDWFLFALLITFISFGLPNAIFLLSIYFLKIGQDFFLKTKYLIIEIILLYSIHYLVNKAVLLIPSEYKFYSTPTISGLKFYFQADFIILCSFIILFIVLFLIYIIQNRRNTTIKI